MEHMRSSPDSFMPYVGEQGEWESYLMRMEMNKTWGDELTLRAASDAYGLPIHLITTEEEHWHSVYEP
jgi:hypothetical protein